MSDSSLIINYSSTPSLSEDAKWVKLEQIMPSEIMTYASLKDLHEMWLSSSTGTSSRSLRSTTCPVEFIGSSIRIRLGFYAWPSIVEFPFTLSSSMGAIDSGQKVQQYKQFSMFIENRNEVDLPYSMSDVVTVWETPTFNRDGGEIPQPTFELVNNNVLKFSNEVFGAVRVVGWATGFHHTVTMELSKPVEEIEKPDDYSIYPDDVIVWGIPPTKTVFNAPKIENLETTITATWQDGEDTETEQLRLEIPPCVEALLAMCPDMYQTITLLCDKISTKQVYYNACTGKVLYVIDGVNPNKYCVDISGQSVVANPWGVGTL